VRTLVTGATGFLGRAIVPELLARGHEVRALVRPSGRPENPDWGGEVEVVHGDLRSSRGLVDALAGVDAVIHLGSPVAAGDDEQFATAAAGTERLMKAMARSSVRRVVIASSLAVYDWSAARGTLTEDTPLANPSERDGYAVSRIWQERVARRETARDGRELTVLRPGFVWGPGREWMSALGPRIGALQLTFGPTRRLPLTYVKNCAHCFAHALEHPRAAGRTFNVVDGAEVTAWNYGRRCLRAREPGVRLVPIPYRAARAGVAVTKLTADRLLGGDSHLPGLFTPKLFEARFAPHSVSGERIRTELGWLPPLSFGECVELAFGGAEAQPAPPAMAGRITSVSASPTEVSSPSSTRTSSSLR
jgi:nucleoside-diphosphate-sugar epimerase